MQYKLLVLLTEEAVAHTAGDASGATHTRKPHAQPLGVRKSSVLKRAVQRFHYDREFLFVCGERPVNLRLLGFGRREVLVANRLSPKPRHLGHTLE
jgi:hypothetical protein